MDWPYSIERYREQLIAIVSALYAMIGLAEGATFEWVSRPLHRAAMKLLRPAESAVRRLIVMAARGMVVEPPVRRAVPPALAIKGKGKGQGKRKRRTSFRLFDPWVYINYFPRRAKPKGPRAEPRICLLDDNFDPRLWMRPPPPKPEPKPSPPDGSVAAASLCRRLDAIRGALADLKGQARRLARWRLRPLEGRGARRSSPLRSGAPPYYSATSSHEVHEILYECHWMAREPEPKPDTS